MSIFGGISVDKSSNYLDTLNESTLKQTRAKNTSCVAEIEQFLGNEIQVGGNVGGSVINENVAGLVSKCVQKNQDQEEIIEEISNDVAQKHTTDKGAAGLVSLTGINLQENKTIVKNILKKEYNDIVNLTCDTSIVQNQANKIKIGGSVGGDIINKNTATLTSECQQVADLNRRVATTLSNKFTQSTETTIPIGTIAIIVAGIVVVSLLGAVGYFLFADEDAPERRRKLKQGVQANFPGRFPQGFVAQPQQFMQPIGSEFQTADL